jgi:hypothetical protein
MRHKKAFQMLNNKVADFDNELDFIDNAGEILARMVSFSEIDKGRPYPTAKIIFDYMTIEERMECDDSGKTIMETVKLAMDNYYAVQ